MLKSSSSMPISRNTIRARANREAQKGSMMLEALIAILIFSMGILAIVGLQSAAIGFSSDAKYRTDASFIANQAIGELWGDRNDLTTKATALAGSVSSLPSGNRTVVIAGNQATVTVTWQLPGQTTAHQYVVIAQING
ncbi:MAG: prepilin-type cleavage/methylation domain-containing protein [Sulfuricellaceae bacterium]|nr:prepilin-type cleavage/methylation domain-containing protein [Sulfuricellaceae bacterium]